MTGRGGEEGVKQLLKRREAVETLERKKVEYADDEELGRAIERALSDERQLWKLEIKNRRHNKKPR